MMSDLDPDFVILEAARWIVETPKERRPGPIVVEVRSRFPVDTHGAIAALRLANDIRSGVSNAAA
ncbi:MAG: hypothetical protein JNK47_20240 [Mesorhizobium sp.]|nr:hypothetical protein [Mesorhizobium sp.]MBL8579541.1 hypothetical protein [Mesorhizobium sp.]